MSSGIFIMIAIIGMLIAIWGSIKLPRNANDMSRSLRDSYMDSWVRRYIKDKFLK
jgi:hypothetical protein